MSKEENTFSSLAVLCDWRMNLVETTIVREQMIIWQQNVSGSKWMLFAKYVISHLTFILFEKAAEVITHPVKSDVLRETTEPDNTDFS